MALNRCFDHGDLDMDNNLSKRVFRTMGIGRENWVSAGSDARAEWAAIIYSLIAGCRLSCINRFAYLRDVLDRISVPCRSCETRRL